MKLSIVVICLNEEKNLPRCFSAIERLDHAGIDVEVLLVDGGSSDHSREIAQSYGARVIDSPKGIPRQRNAGGHAADGDLLAYVDADCELLDGWFATVARHFDDGQRLLLGSAPRLADDASWVAHAYALHWGLESAQQRPTADGRLLSTQSLVMSRDVFDIVGGFDEGLGTSSDLHFVVQGKQAGVAILCDPALRYIHHGEPGSLKEFFRRIMWGTDYAGWLAALKRGEFAQAWRPHYFYGAAVAGEMACLGVSLAAGPVGWLVGVPASLGMLGTTFALPAVSTALRHKRLEKSPQLALMYAAYGLATAGAMAGIGKDKGKRWR